MTLAEARALANYGAAPCISTVDLPSPAPSAQLPVDDQLNHQISQRPLTPSDCNGLSIADIKLMHQFKDMDSYHKGDAIASLHKRGVGLRSRLQKTGVSNFFNKNV